MKIRSKLTLRYLVITAGVFSLFILVVYLFSERTREKEFFRDLKREAVTKANLFLSGRVDAEIMQSIYRNNREFIDEVEVAVYTADFQLLYHDAVDIDIVKETSELIEKTLQQGELNFYEEDFQAVAMIYPYQEKQYVVTAAAYDGYGYAKLERLSWLLWILWLCGMITLAVVAYLLAKGALSPVSRIVDEVDNITGHNLDTRLEVKNARDELGELSETFNRMLDRLEKSFDDQKMFVSNVAHELRTPLAALTAELELALLREERSEEEYRNVIAHSLEDARRLKKLISGLLDLAKANYEAEQIVMEEIRLDELLLDARETVLKGHADYEINLIFDQEPEDERCITVKGNEYLLKTAFINLMENNCKFSADKASHVHISFYEEKAIVRFSDTGIGMVKEDMEKLFIPFYRGENSTYAQGQGIGMALVKKIIGHHHGEIVVHSRVGEGTVFIVEIPHV